MEKKIMTAAMAAAVMFAFGGCAESSVGENEALSDVGASDYVGVVVANDEVRSMAESMAEDMAESMAQSMFESMTRDMEESEAEATAASTTVMTTEETTEAETEDVQSRLWEYRRTFGQYIRTSEDESKTITIDSDVYPYDCEEILLWVDMERPYYNDVEPYDCIDLGNLKNYPNLKKLDLVGNMYNWRDIKLINCDSAASLENLEEIRLSGVAWDGSGFSEIRPLKTLTLVFCDYDRWDFLENLKQVETLCFDKSAVNDLSFINGMSSLTELTLYHAALSNASFDGLEENYSVKRLSFEENSAAIYHEDEDRIEYALTDITGLSKLRGLEYLSIGEGHLTNGEKQMKELQEMLPACEIIYY